MAALSSLTIGFLLCLITSWSVIECRKSAYSGGLCTIDIKDLSRGDIYGGVVEQMEIASTTTVSVRRVAAPRPGLSAPLVWAARLGRGGSSVDSYSLEVMFTTVHKKPQKEAVGSDDPSKFTATNEWQDIGQHQAVPPGLQIKFDMQTGRRQAKLLPPRADSSSSSSGDSGGSSSETKAVHESDGASSSESRTTTTLLLHSLGLSLTDADAHASQIRRELYDFFGGRRSQVTIDLSSVVLIRLLAALCFLGAVVVRDPAGSWRAVVYVRQLMQRRVVKPPKARKPPAYKWTPEACAAYDTAVEQFPKGAEDRWDAIANAVGCTPLEAIARDKLLRAEENRETEVEAARKRELQAAVTAAAHAEHERAERAERAAAEEAAKKKKAAAKAKAAAELAAAQATTTLGGKDNSSWSAKEQKQLERGMKLYPANDTRRWERISGFVASKTPVECEQRYKAIVRALKAARSATQ